MIPWSNKRLPNLRESTQILHGGFSMRLPVALSLACVLLSASACAIHRPAAAPAASAPPVADSREVATAAQVAPTRIAVAPVVVSGAIREALPGDYLRVAFLPAGVNPTCLSRCDAKRAFATATPLYQPPLKLANLPPYSGLVNDDANVLVAMRCRPSDAANVDAVLATWPNVFAAILRDFPLKPGDCDGTPVDPAIKAACYAQAFNDQPSGDVPSALARTFSYAGVLFDGSHKDITDWLKSKYGIYPAFAGTGYSVKDSYYLDDKHPMSSQTMLAKSISSEYVLKNLSLADAGCRCISVAPYPGRSDAPLDPDFVWQAGGDGVCKAVKVLGNGVR